MTSFERRVLFLVKKIPRGRVSTYGEIARILKTGARAVGNALHKNPHLIKIPCHRVVKSDGSLGGYVGGVKRKRVVLLGEGIKVGNKKIVNLNEIIYKMGN